MSDTEKIVAAEVSALLAEADRIDEAEDARFGKNRRGDELPEELPHRGSRLAKIRQAKAALAEQQRQRAREHAQATAGERGDDQDSVASTGAAAAATATPKPKPPPNFIDPDSKIMRTGDGAFRRCSHAQAVVDEDHQVMVATDVNTHAADVGNLIAMTQQTVADTGQAPHQLLADAGYCWANNLAAAEYGTRFYIATGRHRRGDPPPVAPGGGIPNDATGQQRMARKLATNKGGRVYARRTAIVEPVFGQMHTPQNAKQLLLGGLDQARGEWLLLATCHHLRKLHSQIGVAGVAGHPASR